MASSNRPALPDFKARIKQRLAADPTLRAKYFDEKSPEGIKRGAAFCQLSDGTIYVKDANGLLGQGKFGSVYKFNLAPESKSVRTAIAVKQEDAPPTLDDDDEVDIAPYEILNNAVVNHDLYGFGAFAGDLDDPTQPHYALMPFHDAAQISKLDFDGYKKLLTLLNNIANVIKVLHTLEYVHGDLNNKENILCLVNFAVLLIDFDFTRKIGEATDEEPNDKLAPEKRHGSTDAQLAQDIYDLGKLFHELFNDFVLDANFDVRPQPRSFKALVRQMKSRNPVERPSIAAVCVELEKLITKKKAEAKDSKHSAAAAATADTDTATAAAAAAAPNVDAAPPVDAEGDDKSDNPHKRKYQAAQSQPSAAGIFKKADNAAAKNKKESGAAEASAAPVAAQPSDEPKHKKLKLDK